MPEPERAVIFSSVSSDEQAAPGLPSLDEQERAAELYCARQGDLVLARIRVQHSRTYDDLEELCRDCADYARFVGLLRAGGWNGTEWVAGGVTKVVCYAFHRLWRTTILAALVYGIAKRRRVWLYPITTPTVRGAEEGMIWQVMISGVQAEQGVKDIVHNLRRGMRGRARLGIPTCKSQRPYGYLIQGHAADRRLVPCPDEAPAVLRIMERRAQGAGYRTIAAELDALGQPNPNAPRDPGRRPGGWTVKAVNYICHNPLYAGYVRLREWPREPKAPRQGPPVVTLAKGLHEPLITEELWQAVERINESQGRDYGGPHQPGRLFVGLVRCGWCGDCMTYAKMPHGGHYLMCGRYRRHGHAKSAEHPGSCRHNGYSLVYLRRYVLDWLKAAFDDPAAWARALERPEQIDERAARVAALERELAGLEARRRNLLEAVETGGDGRDRRAFVERYDAVGEQCARRQAELERLRATGERVRQTEQALERWADVAAGMEEWSDDQLRPLLRQLVERIILRHGEPPDIRLAGQG